MSWTDDDGESLFYGEADYVKARKVLDNPSSYNLLRDRIDTYRCYLGRPVVWWFDFEWENDTNLIRAYLDTYDVVQEVNIDAILDFMPKEHLSYEGFDGEEVCKRDLARDNIVEWLSNEKGILGYFQDKIDMFMNASTSIAEAKALNKICRTEKGERDNNSIIAEHILTEALDPPSDSEYQAAFDGICNALDKGIAWKGFEHLRDLREEKGLLTVAEPEVEEDQEVNTTCGATRPKSHNTFVDPAYMAVQTNPNSGQESFDNFCAESSDTGPEESSEPRGFTEWVDSKFEPMKRDTPALYWVFFVLLSPIMFPIAFIEAFVEGFTGSSKKKQWYQQDDDGNWIPVVIDEVTGEVTPGEGVS